MRTIVFTDQALAAAAVAAPEGLTETGIRDTADYDDLFARARAAAKRTAWSRNNHPGTD